MLNRKIYKRIEDFYENSPKKALMITGARQVGKSYIIEEFAQKHYKHYVKLDFIEESEYVSIFSKAKDVNEILLRLTAIFGDEMVPGETMIFFDEVQECKELITQIKYLVQDGRYSYILSGSLLGTVLNDIKSVPVGYMDIIRMFPLDFEEFAYANGISKKVIESLHNSFESKIPVDDFVHNRMMSLFELYLIIGGMPAAVSTYIDTKNLRKVLSEQQAIITLYKQDISKYDKENKLYLNEIFDLIPSELNAKNKRFILKTLNQYAKYSKYSESFLWLKNAGVALPTHNVTEPKISLKLSKSSNLFKLFSNDVGLLASQYGGDIQLKLLNHETNINYGAIYENLAAEELLAHGYELYYYNSKKFGEVDFLIESEGEVLPIEIKSGKDYYRHNAMDKIVDHKEYDIDKGYVFCNANIEVSDHIYYFPIYMLMFVQKKELPEEIIFNSDFTDINDLIQ